MKKTYCFLTALVFLSCQSLAQPNIQLATFASGFSKPVDIAHCGDDRLFIVEQKTGKIWILDKDGNRRPEPFITITPIGGGANEQGLLGLAFHPDYASNGYFYVNYTKSNGDTRIARFTVSGNDPDKADPASQFVILEVEQPYTNHNGGGLKFGDDGFLYIGLGDGGLGGDPQSNGQNRASLLAKMLRIDVDTGSPYAIPPSNPFTNQPGTLPEIWALGLRNPWRFSFDRLTGDLWIGDVGQNDWEEVDFQPASSTGGENYGWRCYEGNHGFNTNGCASMSTMVFPVREYQNSNALGCSVTGGFVYRGCQYPALYGRYLYTDYCSGRLWSLSPDGQGGWAHAELANLQDNEFVSFGENKNGELFLAALGSGVVYKLTETSQPWPYSTSFANTTCAGDATGAIAIETNGNPWQIHWPDGSSDAVRSNLPAGSYTVSISSSLGCTAVETFEIGVEHPFNTLPEISLSQDSLLTATAGFSTYQWFLNDLPIANATGQVLVAEQSGNYNVKVTNQGGCEAASPVLPVTLLSATYQIPGIAHIKVHPNPTGDSVNLELATSKDLVLELALTDINGKNLHQETLPVRSFMAKTLDLKHLPVGVYFIRLKNPQGEWVQRLVKQKN